MKFEHTKIYNFENAFRGLRNPKNSWDRSDSDFQITDLNYYNGHKIIGCQWVKTFHPELNWPKNFTEEGENLVQKYADKLLQNGKLNKNNNISEFVMIGPNDMKLAQILIKAGSEHRKFLRQIFVSVDITAPLYFFKEFDTYKIGTTANSTSTMHKLTSQPITLDCFETDDFNSYITYDIENWEGLTTKNEVGMFADVIIEQLEAIRKKYLETKDKRYWKELVRWLPESWLQTRTWTANYEVIRSICQHRRNHKLNEWSGIDNPEKETFIKWARSLPYAQYFIFDNENIPFQIEN